jgi:hypothetical protein
MRIYFLSEFGKRIYILMYLVWAILVDQKAVVIFSVITVVKITSTVFLNVTPCSPKKLSDVSEDHTASIFRDAW